MKQKLQITVRGRRHLWDFDFEGDPKCLQEWRDDGLDVAEVVNTIPECIVGVGLIRVWNFAQDVFNFRNPFRRRTNMKTETIQEVIERGWVECPKCNAHHVVSQNGDVTATGCYEYWNLFVQLEGDE